MLAVPESAQCYLLDRLIDGLDPWYHLFTADVWPDSTTTLAQLPEPQWEGYQPQRVNVWTSAIIRNGRAETTADPVEWVRGATGSPETVFGYFVTDGQGGPLLWAEHVCGRDGIAMESDADLVVVWPLLDMGYLIGERCLPSGGVLVGGDVV
jgi:hypothetical protein